MVLYFMFSIFKPVYLNKAHINNFTPSHMQTIQNSSTDIGKQKGSLRPIMTYAFILAFLFVSIPLDAVAATTYLRQNASTFTDRIESKYGEMVDIASLLHDYDKKMIMAVIAVESEGRSDAQSHKGAQGLMQLMPLTAKSLGVKDAKEPFQNILAGTKYLKQLETIYGFRSTQEAIVAYNMGPSRAKRWLSQYSANEYGYVQKVMYIYDILEEEEKNEQRLAFSVKNKIDMSESHSLASAPLLTKPRSVSLAAFPMTMPSNRKSEIESK